MGKTTNKLPAGFAVQKTRTKNVDWNALFDGQWHVLQQGTAEECQQGKADFMSSFDSFSKVCKDRARERNIGVEIAINQDKQQIAICAVAKKPIRRSSSRKGK